MSLSAAIRSRNSERLIALIAAVGLLMSMMVVFAQPALAHHPEISAHQTCIEREVAISYTSTSWKTWGNDGEGGGNPDVRVEISVEGGAWVEVASGEYNEANGFSFSGTLDGEPYWGKNIRVRSQVKAAWDNGNIGGNTNSAATSPSFLVSEDCFNPACVDVLGVGDYTEFKLEPVTAGTYESGKITVSNINDGGSGPTFDWASTVPVLAVIVKGGPGANVYDYSPVGSNSDNGLHAPLNTSTEKYYGLSHITFCYGENPPEPDLGRIIVVKQVEGRETEQLFDFDPSYDEPFSLADGQSNNSGLLKAGRYTVSERVPSGWTLASATCDSTDESDQSTPGAIDLGEEETVTCTFVNRRTPPPEPGVGNIIVRKVVTTGSDTTQAFTFDASYKADFDLKHGEQNNSGSLNPGTYSVSETVPAGWTLQSATCSDLSLPSAISLQEGETVTCTFTNVQDEVAASILVTVGSSCVVSDGKGTGVIDVSMSVAGGATVVVKSGTTVVATLTQDGTVSVPEGQTYTWEATANEGFEFPAGFVPSGTVSIETCSEEILPVTGFDNAGLIGVSILLLGAGTLLVVSSRRREEI